MLNDVTLMGRLTRDPELRHTAGGKSVCSFSLAVERDFKGPNGERETDFIDIVAWANTAEFASRYLSKGRMAIARGRLQIRDWKDKEGNNRRSAEVVAESVYFGDSRREIAPQDQEQNFIQLADDVGNFAETDQADGQLPF